MDASRATKRRRVSEHFEKEDESEPDWGEAIETQESVMRVAEFPIETNVYIINKASNRKHMDASGGFHCSSTKESSTCGTVAGFKTAFFEKDVEIHNKYSNKYERD